MKRSFAVMAVAVFAAYAWYMLPSPPRVDIGQSSGGHAEHPGDPTALAIGVVQSTDSAAKFVTLSHGPLYHLTMPPMTMRFQVAEPKSLEGIRAGDKVTFHADMVGGTLVVMKIETVN